MWIVGGEDNVIRNNIVWNNIRFGFILAGNPSEAPLPAQVHRNSYTGNVIGTDPLGMPAPNHTAFPPGGNYAPGGSDFFWDETGNDNCWGPHDPASGPITTDPPNSGHPLPIPGPCPAPNVGVPVAPLKISLLLSCLMDGSNPPHTTDVPYPCPWGSTNDAPYENGDEMLCGNGMIDRGEDCDQYGSSTIVPAETCESLGHGPGTLACTTTPRACTWDTSGCLAKTCSEYGASSVRLRNVASPTTDDVLDFAASDLRGGSFDPATEDVSLVVRDDDGSVLAAVIPGGSPGWTASASDATYSDPAGTHGGIVSVSLHATGTFANRFQARVRINASVAAGANARTATAVLRVGNDCWSDTIPCGARGRNVMCRGRAQP